jgi:hypothetical protein
MLEESKNTQNLHVLDGQMKYLKGNIYQAWGTKRILKIYHKDTENSAA